MLLLVAGILLGGCSGPAASPSPPKSMVSPAPPESTIAPPSLPTDTPTPRLPTATSPEITPTTLPLAIPSTTGLPPGSLAFYRLQIDFATTSDWSTLEPLNPEHILAVRAVSTDPPLAEAHASLQTLALNQPIADARAGQTIHLKVDYALDLQALVQPLRFRLQKGDLKDSEVTVSLFSDSQVTPLKTIQHRGVTNSGTNPLAFSVDLSPLKAVEPQVAQVKPLDVPKMVWAFYYPWYTSIDWSSNVLQDWPETRYASADPAAIARQVEQAQSAGIDGFISSWWGPGSDTDRNLRALLEIAQLSDFKVSIYFETLAGENEGPLDEDTIETWLAEAIRSYGDHPAFMQVDGKPLIVIWASDAVPLDAWERIFTKLNDQGLPAVYLAMGYRSDNLDVFDGVHDYGIFTIPDLAQTYLSTERAVRYYSLLSDNPAPKLWVATVMPGYDDTLQPSRQGLVQERQNGDYYRATWDAALQSDPDWIFITSWNEWYEHTHIEPSVSFGDQYLQITREYADRWNGE
jgi:hypothetical protein